LKISTLAIAKAFTRTNIFFSQEKSKLEVAVVTQNKKPGDNKYTEEWLAIKTEVFKQSLKTYLFNFYFSYYYGSFCEI